MSLSENYQPLDFDSQENVNEEERAKEAVSEEKDPIEDEKEAIEVNEKAIVHEPKKGIEKSIPIVAFLGALLLFVFFMQQVFYKNKQDSEDSRKLQQKQTYQGPDYYSNRGLKLDKNMNPKILANLEKAGIVKPLYKEKTINVFGGIKKKVIEYQHFNDSKKKIIQIILQNMLNYFNQEKYCMFDLYLYIQSTKFQMSTFLFQYYIIS